MLSPCEKIQLLYVLVCILNLVTRSCWISKKFILNIKLSCYQLCLHSFCSFWMSWKVVSLFYTFHFYLFIPEFSSSPAPVWVTSIISMFLYSILWNEIFRDEEAKVFFSKILVLKKKWVFGKVPSICLLLINLIAENPNYSYIVGWQVSTDHFILIKLSRKWVCRVRADVGGCSKTAGLLVERPSGGIREEAGPSPVVPVAQRWKLCRQGLWGEELQAALLLQTGKQKKKCIGSEIDTFQYFHFFVVCMHS